MALLYEKTKGTSVPVNIKILQSLMTSTIIAIRVQDIVRNIVFSWDKNGTYPNGYWDNAGGGGNNAPVGESPNCTPGDNNLYIAFWAVNGYNFAVNMSLGLSDANGILTSKSNILTAPGAE